MRLIGATLSLLGVLAVVGELAGISFPTARWFFETSRKVPWLNTSPGDFPWFGWLGAGAAIACGFSILIRTLARGPANPVTVRRIRRFREIKRGYYSLLILLALMAVAMLDQVIVGKQALAVQYKGNWVFPAFRPVEMKNKDFGITAESPEAPANYRKLRKTLKGG
jgi:microcin C transport system permease protein